MNRILFIWLLMFSVCSLHLGAQSLSNIRQKKIAVSADTLQLDSLSIVPGSVSIQQVAQQAYIIDAVNARLRWLQKPTQDSVTISYRVFPYKLNAYSFRYRYDSIANFFRIQPAAARTKKADIANGRIADFGAMNYSGSFGRSLSFGNTQDAVVNSLFNLQINGMLPDSIEIAAAITDNNIPIQPDGTTQQLNEFDRIWMQFRKKPWEVNIGDIDVRQQPTYFLSYFKRQQGLAFQTTNKISKHLTYSMMTSGAIAKGKFTRNVFQGLEGNQGPYRLTGANNELFFVVLAGTERVFIDGVQLQRGENQDYVINYNTAEITFTPRQLITKDKRIQIEFEYADRNYLNSLLYLSNQLEVGSRLKLKLAMYGNTDARNSSIQQTLDTQQKQFLSDIGDSIQNAFYPVAVRDSFSVSKILYVKKDTIAGANTYSIYQYKSTEDSVMYRLSFSEVGQGRGNYVPMFDAANGKVYQWVAPVNNVPQGSYEPVSLLITPKKQQIITTGLEYNFSKHTLLKAETGFSKYDVNTFSSKDKANDGGRAYKLQLTDNRMLMMKRKQLLLQSALGYEHVGERFKPLERLRSIEFLRDWGLPYTSLPATEQLPSASVRISDSSKHSFQYDYTGYLRSDHYKGNRHLLQHNSIWKSWRVKNVLSYTSINADTYQGYFLRPNFSVSKALERWNHAEIGGSYSLEHSQLQASLNDSLLPNSFSFRDWNAFIRSRQDRQNRFTLSYFSRANKTPVKTAFEPLDVNHNFSVLAELLKSRRHQFRINGTYRILNVKAPQYTNQQSENSLASRAEYLLNVWKGALTGNALYELGAGQEQQRDYSYVEVPAGRGEYTWIDYNADGVPQLNEFEVAQFTDQARYIRIFTPTNRFIKASYNTFNYAIQLSPRMLWRNATQKGKKFLSRFSWQSSLQSNQKQVSDGRFHFNPFQQQAADTSLIALNMNIANTISFNRFSTNWGLDYTNIRNSAKAILTYGFETRKFQDNNIRLRKNIGRRLTTEFTFRKGSNALLTPNPKFDNRNFNIELYSIEPKLSYTKGAVWRTAFSYKYDDKSGTSVSGHQQCTIRSLMLEGKYNVLQSSVINGKFTYSNIGFTGPTNTTMSYILLDALQPGKNMLWNLDFTKRLMNSLELSFQYEGRKAGETRTVHIGRAALRAIL